MPGLLKGIDNDKSALGEKFMVGDNFIDLGLAGLLKAQHYFQWIDCVWLEKAVHYVCLKLYLNNWSQFVFVNDL